MPHRVSSLLNRFAPGLALCAALACVAALGERLEILVFGRAWLESLVLAILLGTAVRTAWPPRPRMTAGIDLSAKLLLEIAVVLLGLSVRADTIVAAGLPLIAGIAGVVVCALALSYAISRSLGLDRKMAVLIACGNSICGNSAIAATAPVIEASAEDVASSIAFTAIFGVAVVLALPVLAAALRLSLPQSGILAGLTVYAVPQVLAATAPIGPVAVQIGTLVKLIRVMMLGPVVFAISLRLSRSTTAPTNATRGAHVPWFVIGFLAAIAFRAVVPLPAAGLALAAVGANILTIVSMAALGLGVDIRAVAGVGPRVVASVALSLVSLVLLSLGLIGWLAA